MFRLRHVAGVHGFLRLAKQNNWRTIFLGPATPIRQVIEMAIKEKADLVGVSYRLTPENGEILLAEFAEYADELKTKGVRFAFGGTPQVVDRVRKLNFFEAHFDGSERVEEVAAYLRGQGISSATKDNLPQHAIERIRWKAPSPLIRHHFGLPDLEETIQGIEEIAISRVVDVISLGIDQDAQENFFNPDKQDIRRRGAGGVPVRTPEDYSRLYQATRSGNFPLMRTYSGTDDFIRLAELYVKTINIAWAAVPLFWFNQMDGRGPWDLEGSIQEHIRLMRWYGERNIPVEANEAHHWGMRADWLPDQYRPAADMSAERRSPVDKDSKLISSSGFALEAGKASRPVSCPCLERTESTTGGPVCAPADSTTSTGATPS